MSPRETAGAFLLRNRNVLLEWRPEDARVYAGMWDCPGGHLEPGERPEQALVREFEEELGIVVESGPPVAILDDREPRSGQPYRHFVYVVTEWSGTIEAKLGQRLAWYDIDEARALESLNPLLRDVLESLR